MAGRITVVTGGARGIGLAITRALLEEGGRVAIWDFNCEGLDEVASQYPSRVLAVEVDVSSSASVNAAAQHTKEQLGSPDSLVNNAGVTESEQVWELSDESLDRQMRINAFGPMYCIRALVNDMREARYGKIVNIGSMSAVQGRPSASPAYAASKGAVLGMTVSLARNLGEYGICVNAINPGFIRTDLFESYSEAQIIALSADIPLHRRGHPGEHGRPEDVANAALYLCSAESDYVSGAFLGVNGATRTG